MLQTISLSIWAAKYVWQASTTLSKVIKFERDEFSGPDPRVLLLLSCHFRTHPLHHYFLFRFQGPFALGSSFLPLSVLELPPLCHFARYHVLRSVVLSVHGTMVVAAPGHGEIHFHLHFQFRLKLISYFTLGCIFTSVSLESKMVLLFNSMYFKI